MARPNHFEGVVPASPAGLKSVVAKELVMIRRGSLLVVAFAVASLVPEGTNAQAAAGEDMAHSHASLAVDCRNLAMPPWEGLSATDRERFDVVQQSVSGLTTPRAALAAGFRPALGDIPGMGVHYVHPVRSRDGIQVDAPDHLMFAPVNGEPTLVGAAYAFIGVPNTDEPLPYESDLAHWHDHPQFAPEGQTLHMLHVWFTPSSNGPFAGLNFWLPFHGAGIAPPSACWMADDGMAQMIQKVAFALVPPDNEVASQVERARGVVGAEEVPAGRQRIIQALGAAAEADDMQAWMTAAERFLGHLTEREQARMETLLEVLMAEQMSSAERGRGGGG